jgi:hypothetical protein
MPLTENPLVAGFRQAFRLTTPLEEIEFRITEALKDLADESRPEHERFNSAIRLLCCVPAIGDRLPESAMNEIFGRKGITLPSAD